MTTVNATGEEYSLWLMAGYMMGVGWTIKSKDTVCANGQMEGNINTNRPILLGIGIHIYHCDVYL